MVEQTEPKMKGPMASSAHCRYSPKLDPTIVINAKIALTAYKIASPASGLIDPKRFRARRRKPISAASWRSEVDMAVTHSLA